MSELKPIKYALFPTLIYHTPFLTKDECDMYIKELYDLGTYSPDIEIYPHQTTDKLHLLNDKWKELSNRVIKVIDSIADEQYIIRDCFYTTCMWANISTGDNYSHQTHIHPNSFFSSIIYLRGNKPSPTIFYDPRVQAVVIEPSRSKYPLSISQTCEIPFIEGSMVIFPSWLSHSVGGNENDNSKRVTISCNSMLHAEITEHASYLKI